MRLKQPRNHDRELFAPDRAGDRASSVHTLKRVSIAFSSGILHIPKEPFHSFSPTLLYSLYLRLTSCPRS